VSLPAIAGVHDGEERYALAYLAHLADHPGADQVVMPSAYEITPDRATVVRRNVETLAAAAVDRLAANQT